jgi:uncharacterized protein DUF5916/cellulose/xylan binding protein with CBM9 domain
MTRSVVGGALAACLLLATDGLTASSTRKPGETIVVAVAEAAAVRDATAIKLDGELTDEVWSRAKPIDGFVQRDPKEGAPATYATEAKVAYDARHIYIAVTATDPEPDKIVGHLTRRDTDSPSDWIRVAIDSYHDRRTAYDFGVNPAGVKVDRYHFNDGDEDRGWDAVWDVAVSKSATGWRAEFRIPLSQLRFRREDKPTFGIAIIREIGRLNEMSTWPLIAKSVNGVASQFGELHGLELTASPKRLELMPYTVSQVSTQPATDNPLVKTPDPDLSVGLDMKYAITPGLTLTATVNPDFGQVEADPAVVNLSAFETFFSERRPFFVEGSGVFRFDMDCNDGSCTGLFYTRRIGRRPQIDAEEPEDGFVASPTNTTIFGATKVTGRIGGISIGIMNALTSEETARVADGPLRSTTPIEPFTSYTIGRVRKEFTNQSSLGMMLTATNRRLGEASSPLHQLAGSAYSGGVDFDWRLRQNRYAVAGYVAGSTVHGSPQAIEDLQENNVHSFQRPDADHVELDPTRTSLDGSTGFVALRKIGGERVRFESNVGFKTPGLETNALGFIRRADQISQSNWMQWRDEKPGKFVRTFRFNVNQWSGHNFDGDRLNFGGNVNAHWTFTNNWATGGGVTKNIDGFDDRATRGGPGAYFNGMTSLWTYVETDNRKPVSVETFVEGGHTSFGPSFFAVGPSLTFRPASSLSISGGVRFNRENNDAQWVENVDAADDKTHYVFAHLAQRTVSLTTRVNYTMSPTLSLQIYAEPFVSAGEYTDYKELLNGRAKDPSVRYGSYAYDGNADFNFRSFRTTNVLRWEYRPGSALFAVWQQGREENASIGTFRFNRDFRGVFAAPASNVFLLKFSYWLNY